MDMGTNMSDIEVRPHRDGIWVMHLDDNAQATYPLANVIQMPMPYINESISGYDPESLRGSRIRTQDTGIQESKPQLDGTCICSI